MKYEVYHTTNILELLGSRIVSINVVVKVGLEDYMIFLPIFTIFFPLICEMKILLRVPMKIVVKQNDIKKKKLAIFDNTGIYCDFNGENITWILMCNQTPTLLTYIVKYILGQVKHNKNFKLYVSDNNW